MSAHKKDTPVSFQFVHAQKHKLFCLHELAKMEMKRQRQHYLLTTFLSISCYYSLSLYFSRPTSFSLLSTHPCSCFNCPWFFYIFMAAAAAAVACAKLEWNLAALVPKQSITPLRSRPIVSMSFKFQNLFCQFFSYQQLDWQIFKYLSTPNWTEAVLSKN